MISVSVPNEVPNFKLILKGEEFPICKFQFCRYSLRFQKDSSLFNTDSYSINSDVTKESLQSFISACQGAPFKILGENVLDLQLLCTEFEVPSILASIQKYFDEHENELLLERLEFNVKHNKEISDLVDKIASKIDDYISLEKLYDIPENVLYQIYGSKSRKTANEHRLYDFAVNYAKKKGQPTSSLLTFINYASLSKEEIKELSENSLMPDKISTSYIFPFLLRMIAQAEEQENRIKLLQDQVSKSHERINKEISDLGNNLSQIKSETDNTKNKLDQIKNEYHTISDSLCKMDKSINDNSNLENAYAQSGALLERVQNIEKKTRLVWAQKNPLKGVFYEWRNNHQQKNPASNFVNIITPKQPEDIYKASNLLEYEQPLLDACYYLNQNLTNESQSGQNWIDFDFGENKISPYAFTIRTNSLGETISHPRDFELQGSDDRNDWVSLIKVENAKSLNGARMIQTFFCDSNNNENQKTFRYLRYLQHDSHYMYNDRFGIISLSAIEFFGDLSTK